MGAVPHSGNKCSGMCATPCDHPDCWQCAKERSMKQDKEAAKRILALSKASEKAGGPSILSGVPAEKPADWQKATITRGSLEALAQKAGVRMDWNNGSPVFYDDAVHDMERRYEQAERAVLEQKVKELEKIAAQHRAGALTERAARSLAEAANKQMDTMVNDIVKNKVEATLREDMVANEALVKASFRAAGASEADIAAVEKLLAGGPPDPEPEPEDDPEDNPLTSNFNSVVSHTILKRLEENLRKSFVSPGAADGRYTAIVHPDEVADWKKLLGAKVVSVRRAMAGMGVEDPE